MIAMRLSLALIAIATALMCGCSSLIAHSGKDLSKLTTREEVHREFGEPEKIGVVGDYACEDYTTRRKISEPWRSNSQGMGFAMTFGALELVNFPMEVYLLCSRTVMGESVRFAYDDTGKVMRVFLDGEKLEPFLAADGWAKAEYERRKKAAETSAQPSTDTP
jgi:hypothetical protein